MIETGLNIVGLLLTGSGALIASRAVIISEEQATQLSGTYLVSNVELRNALLRQSRAAQKGLWFIVAGTALQVIALMVQTAREFV